MRALVIGSLCVACSSTHMPETTGSGGHGQGGGSGGSVPEADCWSAPLDRWELTSVDMTMLGGSNPRDPMVSADALRLHYSATSENGLARIYQTSRANRDVPFEGGTVIAEWLGQNPLGHPWRLDNELFMARDDSLGVFRVVASTFDGSSWSLPAQPGAQINEGASNGDPTLTANGLRIVFTHAPRTAAVTQLAEGARSDATPGTPFSTFNDVAIPGVAAQDYVVCPVLSADGLSLYFSTLDLAIEGAVAAVWMTERQSLDHAWEAPVHLTAFDAPSAHVCMHSMSADGCEVWLERFSSESRDSGYTVAKRRPTR